MVDFVRRGAAPALIIFALALGACSSGLDNGLDGIPLVQIKESERIALTAGAIGGDGLTLSDADSGAQVAIPGDAVFTLDASQSDDVPAVTPTSIVITLRPVSQTLAAQDGDLLTADGLNLPNLKKVGALAVLPVIARTSSDVTITIPLTPGTTGDLSIWRFVPEDQTDVDGELAALPTVGHWRFLDSGTVANGNVVFSTDTFGQFLVTTDSGTGGGGGTPPTAALTADPLIGDKPLTVNFNAGTSTDAGGTITKYEWDYEGDGTFVDPGTVPTATHIYEADGEFDAAVRVTDNDNETATATVHIIVGNAKPVIGEITPEQADVNIATTFTVTATDPDPEGSITLFEWDLDNDGTYETPTAALGEVTTTFDTVGTETIGVRVTDNETGASTKTFDIEVVDPSANPVSLEAAPNPAPLPTTGSVTVTFTTTLNPSTTTHSHVFYNFGDGSAEVEAAEPDKLHISHDYATANTYTATVRVVPTSGTPPVDGAPISATETVVITAPGGGGPSATLSADKTSGTGDATTPLVVNFQTVLNPVTTTYTKVEYKAEESAAFVEETETPLTWTHSYNAPGTYVATVQVTPTTGAPFTAPLTITVTAPTANTAPNAQIAVTPVAGNTRAFDLSAAASTDAEGAIASYAWDFESDGTTDATGITTTVAYPPGQEGDHVIKLTVTDNGTPPLTDTALAIVQPAAP